jgi:peptide deformylase
MPEEEDNEEGEKSEAVTPPPPSEFFGQLVHVGDPLLRRTAQRVTDYQQAKDYADLLARAVREIVGAGLAANQLGIDLQIAVAWVRKTDLFPNRPESGLVTLINPEIVSYGAEYDDDWEGCFSVPSYVGLVPRSKKIRVNMETLEGESITIDFEGYLARVIQHEIDHLHGKVYMDRLLSTKNFFTRENYRKYILKTEG